MSDIKYSHKIVKNSINANSRAVECTRNTASFCISHAHLRCWNVPQLDWKKRLIREWKRPCTV